MMGPENRGVSTMKVKSDKSGVGVPVTQIKQISRSDRAGL
jgi:hypothetical protein